MNTANPIASPLTPNLKSWARFWPHAIVSLVWVVLILIYALQMWAMEDTGWRLAFARASSDWLPWIILSPAMFWLATKIPIGPGRIVWPVSVSLVVCVGAMFAAEWGFQTLRPVLTGDPLPNNWGSLSLTTNPGSAANPERGPGFGPPPDGFAPKGPGPQGRGQPTDYPGWTDSGPARGPAAGGYGGRGGRLGPGGRGPAAPAQGPMQHMMHLHFPISLFVIMAANAYAYFLQMRERERKASELARNLAEARLSALQMQLHPHFLFNALNATTALIRKNPDAAEEMIANLSELLRLALSVRDRHEVTIRQELGYLECYLAIEHVRFGDRLKIHWDVDEMAKDARVPVLLLQPIVENAIRHGIERRNVDIGQVWITVARTGDRLHMSIRDNGPGPKSNVSPARRGQGVGLDNTRARLAALHATTAEVRIETGAGGGCVVTIEMPFVIPKLESSSHENQSAHR